jgi:anti-anti-sigma factor
MAEDRLDETAVLDVEGALCAPVSAELRQNVQRLLRRGRRRIVLNLAAVSDLDAAGIGELVTVYNATMAANGVLRITHVSGTARELLDRVGLLAVLNPDSKVA